MSVVKRIIRDSTERLKVNELLSKEFEQAGYGGITLTKTPLGAQINLFAMRPGRVIGKRGRSIKAASERLEEELGISNPQITVVEVEVPEINPGIMASRIANALERGVHYRRAIFWALRRIMESGALGCEIVLNGKLRSNRHRFEKVSEGYLPKSGDPAIRCVKSATIHVKLKRGILGVNVAIIPPDAKFPDKISLEGLPEVEVPEEYELPEGVEPEAEAAAPEPAKELPIEPGPQEQGAEPVEKGEPAEEPKHAEERSVEEDKTEAGEEGPVEPAHEPGSVQGPGEVEITGEKAVGDAEEPDAENAVKPEEEKGE